MAPGTFMKGMKRMLGGGRTERRSLQGGPEPSDMATQANNTPRTIIGTPSLPASERAKPPSRLSEDSSPGLLPPSGNASKAPGEQPDRIPRRSSHSGLVDKKTTKDTHHAGRELKVEIPDQDYHEGPPPIRSSMSSISLPRNSQEQSYTDLLGDSVGTANDLSSQYQVSSDRRQTSDSKVQFRPHRHSAPYLEGPFDSEKSTKLHTIAVPTGDSAAEFPPLKDGDEEDRKLVQQYPRQSKSSKTQIYSNEHPVSGLREGTRLPQPESLHWDSTRISLDRESWSSSNAGSDMFRRSEGYLQKGYPVVDSKGQRISRIYNQKDLLTNGGNPSAQLRHSNKSERGTGQRQARASRLESLKAQDLHDFLAKYRTGATASERGAPLTKSPGSPQRLSSQDVRQGLHLRTPNGSSSRPASGSQKQQPASPTQSVPAGSSAVDQLFDRRRPRSGIQSRTASAHLEDASDYELAEAPVRPHSAAIARHRALQTVPYSFGRPEPIGSKSPDGRDVVAPDSQFSPPFDESLQWIVGAEDAKSLQQGAWQDKPAPAARPQDREQQPWTIRSSGGLLNKYNQDPAQSLDKLKLDLREASSAREKALRGLQTQPFRLDLEGSTSYNPLHSQPIRFTDPLYSNSPSPKRAEQPADPFSSKLDARLLALGKVGLSGSGRDPEEGGKSQSPTPLEYKTSHDYSIGASTLPYAGELQVVYENQNDRHTQGYDKTPSVKTDFSAKTGHHTRLRSIHQDAQTIPTRSVSPLSEVLGSDDGRIWKEAKYGPGAVSPENTVETPDNRETPMSRPAYSTSASTQAKTSHEKQPTNASSVVLDGCEDTAFRIKKVRPSSASSGFSNEDAPEQEDAQLTELRGALSFLQGKLGGLEKELHAKREAEALLRAQCTSSEQELREASERAEKAEAAKSDLHKLVDELRASLDRAMNDKAAELEQAAQAVALAQAEAGAQEELAELAKGELAEYQRRLAAEVDHARKEALKTAEGQSGDKARLSAEVSKLQTQSRRSKQERDQLDNLLAASTHKHAQQDFQIQSLQADLKAATESVRGYKDTIRDLEAKRQFLQMELEESNDRVCHLETSAEKAQAQLAGTIQALRDTQAELARLREEDSFQASDSLKASDLFLGVDISKAIDDMDGRRRHNGDGAAEDVAAISTMVSLLQTKLAAADEEVKRLHNIEALASDALDALETQTQESLRLRAHAAELEAHLSVQQLEGKPLSNAYGKDEQLQ